MFGFIKEKLKKIYDQVTSKIGGIFSNRTNFDESFLQELREVLLGADVGVTATEKTVQLLRNKIATLKTSNAVEIKQVFEDLLVQQLNVGINPDRAPKILLMVGVNGTGKTTFLAKLAKRLSKDGKRVLLVAGDTFRAAATEQLVHWGKSLGIPVHAGRPEQDPAALIFDACQRYIAEGFDHILIDTAGRLQTKINLMKELEKIRRVLDKALPSEPVAAWLSVDAMLGQNSLRQAEIFHEATKLDGVVLTKFDGTGKGGILLAIAEQFKLPVVYITYGEEVDALKDFSPSEFVKELVNG